MSKKEGRKTNVGFLIRTGAVLFALGAISLYAVKSSLHKEYEPVEIPYVPLKFDADVNIAEASPYINIKEEKTRILDKYKELHEQNGDMKGWLKIEGTNVDYPVMQKSGYNEESTSAEILEMTNYWLYKDFYGEYSRSGSIVANYSSQIIGNKRPANMTLYGHNMSSGAFFHDIAYYDPIYYGEYGVQFYKDHPTIQFDTLYEEGTYKIFAAMQVNVNSSDGAVFHYTSTHDFKDEASFLKYYGEVFDRSMFFNTDVDLKYGDEVILMSTCDFTAFPHIKPIRFVVYARRVREGENPAVDTSKYIRNPNPKMYDAYYNAYGGSFKGRAWDSTLLKGRYD